MTTVPEAPAPSLRLRIDTDALQANWRYLDSQAPGAATGAAVKANAYGLGVDKVVPALRDAGANELFLAHWSEVPDVIAYSEGTEISVLHGVRNDEEARFAMQTEVAPVINSLAQAAIWNAAGGGTCHLMVDTGINRLGVSPDDLSDPAIKSLDIDILMSHLASADEDSAQNAAQHKAFVGAMPSLRARRYSLSNSAGIMLGADYHFDLTRPGIALYGGSVHPDMESHIAQVAFPEAAVIQMRDLKPGDAVGYNATWTAKKTLRAATISIGYADGFLRQMGPGGALQHEGKALPIIGKVSMDMIVVDASDSALREGDFVEIPMYLPEIAARSGLSQYELLTVVGHRFARS